MQLERFRPDSDVDVLFEFWEEKISDQDYLKNWDSLRSKLEQLFDRKIDLVHFPSLKNPYFIEEMQEKARLLYDSTPEKVSLRSYY